MGQVNKLGYVDNKLGAPTSGQQTTRTVFHTIPLAAGATPTSLEFFKDFQGLTAGQTNLTTNKLDSMESMVIKTIWFAQTGAGILYTPGFGTPLTCSVFVGNEQVVKDLPVHFQNESGQAYDRLHPNAGVVSDLDQVQVPSTTDQIFMPIEVRLLTDIVIPPQVNFYVRLQGGPGVNFALQATNSVVCALSGYGKIFSAGMSF